MGKEKGGYTAEKPDEAELAGARRKLNKAKTLEKSQLPTEDQIKDMEDQAAKARKEAEAKLQEGKNKLKPPSEVQEKQRLPTADDINAENSAALEAAEILNEAKNKLKAAPGEGTVEKQALPTKEDIE